ncbi:MAG: hypothetical protein MPW17_05915 [Candidatus Manganitrophus sp.]|nr:hypothetical protein [Candidatus Manganitrophus sp.]WDT73382.1 MAG: hypothetical protein MPW17_05915 [Candidatus Manganitrophus sp.]
MLEAGGRKKGEALTYFLEGKRIYLREVRPSDVNERYYRWMNDPEITRFLESRFAPNAIENLRDYVAGKLGDRDNIFLAIVLKKRIATSAISSWARSSGFTVWLTSAS